MGTLSEVFISVSNMLILPVVAKTTVIPNFVIDPTEVADDPRHSGHVRRRARAAPACGRIAVRDAGDCCGR